METFAGKSGGHVNSESSIETTPGHDLGVILPRIVDYPGPRQQTCSGPFDGCFKLTTAKQEAPRLGVASEEAQRRAGAQANLGHRG